MKQMLDNYEKLTEAEKRVFNHIVNNPTQIIDLTINELAEKSFTSKTVVVNTAQKLDFQGYADLKFYIRNSLNKKSESVSSIETKNQILKLSEMTGEIINFDNIDKVAQKIRSAKSVYIAGRGTSKACSIHLNHLLLTMGVKCLLIEDYTLLTAVSKKLEKDENLILISLSGKTKKIVEAAKIAKSREATIISLTSFTNNPLSKLADINLYGATNSVDTAEDDDISRIGLFILAEILAHQVKININEEIN